MPPFRLTPKNLKMAAQLIAEARRPIIIVGHGAFGARDRVAELAERLGAPVLTTFKAKGLVPDDHPNAAGVLMSVYLGSIGFGFPAAMGAWAVTRDIDALRGREVISVSGDSSLATTRWILPRPSNTAWILPISFCTTASWARF